MDLTKYKSLFVSEANDHLDQMSNEIIELEKQPENIALINEIFRHAHSLKGMAASMEYDVIADVAHALEDVIAMFRDDELAFTRDAFDILLDGVDIIEELIDAVERDNPLNTETKSFLKRITDFCTEMKTSANVVEDGSELIGLNSVAVHAEETVKDEKKVKETELSNDKDLQKKSEVDRSVVEQGDIASGELTSDSQDRKVGLKKCLHFNVLFDESTRGLNARIYLLYKKLEVNSNEILTIPDIDDIRSAKVQQGNIEIFLTSEKQDGAKYESIIKAITGVQSVEFEFGFWPGTKEEAIEQKSEEEKNIQTGGTDEPVVLRHTASEQIAHVKVKTKVLDFFMDTIGELITSYSRLKELSRGLKPLDKAEFMSDELEQLNKLIMQLHHNVISTRMVSLSGALQWIPRAVRDMGRKSNKKIELIMTETEIEMDRVVLGQITNPINHVLRNCIDHGIEDPETRKQTNKPEEGQIQLKASRYRDLVYLEIIDDGKGISQDEVARTAIDKELVSQEQIKKMSKSDILELICLPGFSTTDIVSSFSGRGVGMDAVRTTIQQLGGKLELDSTVGKGTKFTFMLPYTVSIISVLLVKNMQRQYAIPLSKVSHTMLMEPNNLKIMNNSYFIPFNDELLPVYHLNELVSDRSYEHEWGLQPAIIVDQDENKNIVIVVDEIFGYVDVVSKPLGALLEQIEGLGGVAILGDGSPVFILDPARFLST